MHRHTRSVVPICSHAFEPMAIIGRGPGSMSATRRAQRLNRSSICSDPGSSSSFSASAADNSNVSADSSYREESQAFSPVDQDGSGFSDLTLVTAEPEAGDLAALRKNSDESGSSSPDSLTLPPLFEAHMQYSQSLFAHTAKMWEADRLAIERSRDQRPKEAKSRLSVVIGRPGSSSSTSKSRSQHVRSRPTASAQTPTARR